MIKIKQIRFNDHPVLGNLVLDFCDEKGNPADTVIFAGENGAGKSTILNELYKITSHQECDHCELDMKNESDEFSLRFYLKHSGSSMPIGYVSDDHGMRTWVESDEAKKRYPCSAIFSDVDINFHSTSPSSVTSLVLDGFKESRRSSTNLPQEINQLLIDIQAQDDADFALAGREARKANPKATIQSLHVEERMPRFTNAFTQMFDTLAYSRVENKDNHKVILFRKNGKDIPIEELSSGEKQVVYRGCFLLKDANALNGAFVFIDEPEISLHPAWQMKIMDYYKGIFTNEKGEQTSQIFAVTHSPFIIHNENRKNDKVIVLARDNDGKIIVKDKPEYYKCDSIQAVEDAFSIQNFSADKPTVYLEGRTDEKYFNQALKIFDIDVPFEFKWVGYLLKLRTFEITAFQP